MNFLADESVDQHIVDRLRQAGYQVWYVAEMLPGISDEEVLDHANREKALLLTADKDFGELVFRQRRLTQGVVLIRLAGLSPSTKANIVAALVEQHHAAFSQAFSVISPWAIRIRQQEE